MYNLVVMNNNVILQRERSNSGNMIHCHYHTDNGTWIAYGKSAFGLHNMVADAGFSTVNRYSTEMEMACVMVGSNTLSHICSNEVVQSIRDDSYITIDAAVSFSNEEYAGWVDAIRSESAKKSHRWVQTFVSDEISDEREIVDGMSPVARATKRIADMFFAFVAMVLFSPLYLITYLLIRLEDGGPAIYRQERVGRGGRPFSIYKFRSMRVDAERLGPQLSHSGGERDPRLTRVGRFIRAHHIDELPQLWNVLRGDMSFIGPRPERKYFIDQIMEYDSRYAYLYQIRPGVTSYATLYNGYTDTMEKMLRRLEFDLFYLRHRSMWFDIKILCNTFCAIVFGKKI